MNDNILSLSTILDLCMALLPLSAGSQHVINGFQAGSNKKRQNRWSF